jgi:hypothetical protein
MIANVLCLQFEGGGLDKLSLTYFVDFVVKSGSPKLTVVRNFKDRGEYEPWGDFYKQLREGIVQMHTSGTPKTNLDAIIPKLTDIKKTSGYPPLITGYKKFLGRKTYSWFPPPSNVWSSGGLDVTINPELGLDINGVRHIIKLYFKKDKLTKTRADLITHLLAHSLGQPASTIIGVLDVRNSSLYTTTAPNASLHPLLVGEAASFATIFKSL